MLGITRRDQRADQGAASLNELLPGAEDITLLDTLKTADDTEGEYDHVELVQGVQSTVSTLPEPQRTLVQMHDLQGRQLSETGQRCGLSATDTYKTHKRALQSLRRNPRLRALANAHHLDQITNWYKHVGMMEYNNTWMSSTEAIAFWREEHAKVW